MTAALIHDPNCTRRAPDGSHSDAAKRIADWYNLHAAQRHLAYGQFIAVALADGSSDGTLYASRAAAVAYQRNRERRYMYLQIRPHGMSVCDAESLLWAHRNGADTGIEAPDRDAPGGGYTMIPRVSDEEYAMQVAALARRTWPLQRIS